MSRSLDFLPFHRRFLDPLFVLSIALTSRLLLTHTHTIVERVCVGMRRLSRLVDVRRDLVQQQWTRAADIC